MAKTAKPKGKRRPPAPPPKEKKAPLEGLIRAVLVSVLLIPLVFLPPLFDLYDLPKATFLRILAVFLVALALLDVVLQKRFKVPQTRLLPPMIAFGAVAILATIVSVNPTISLIGGIKRHEGLPTFLTYILIAVASASYLKKQDWPLIANFLAIVTIIVAVYGIFQRFGMDIMDFSGGRYDVTRAFSSTGNPVFLGSFLALTIPLYVYLMLNGPQGPVRWLYSSAVAASLPTLLFTYSRGAWIGAALGIAVALAAGGWRHIADNWRRLALAAAVVVVLVGATALMKPPSTATSSSLVARAVEGMQGGGTVATRFEMWGSSIAMMSERPLLGFGLEVYKDIFPKYRTMDLIRMEGEMAMADRPHNELLYIGASTGLLGLGAFLWLIFAFFFFTVQGAFRLRESVSKSAALAIVAGSAGHLTANFFSFSMVTVTPIFWLLMGFAGVVVANSARRTIPIPEIGPIVRYPLYGLVATGGSFFILFSLNLLIADAKYNQSRFSRAYEDPGSAIAQAGAAVRMNPYQNRYRIDLGAAYMDTWAATQDKKWIGEAIKVYRDGTIFDPLDEDIWVNLGNVYLTSGPERAEEAKQAFLRALEIDPYFSIAHEQLALIDLGHREYQKAESHLRQALQINPQSAAAYTRLGRVFREQNNPAEARKMYEAALKIQPDYQEAKQGLTATAAAQAGG